jgi:hypothetical protein
MGLAWKGLIPLGLVNLFLVAVVLTLGLPKHLLAGTAILLFVAAMISTYQLQRTLNQSNPRVMDGGIRGVSA